MEKDIWIETQEIYPFVLLIVPWRINLYDEYTEIKIKQTLCDNFSMDVLFVKKLVQNYPQPKYIKQKCVSKWTYQNIFGRHWTSLDTNDLHYFKSQKYNLKYLICISVLYLARAESTSYVSHQTKCYRSSHIVLKYGILI